MIAVLQPFSLLFGRRIFMFVYLKFLPACNITGKEGLVLSASRFY